MNYLFNFIRKKIQINNFYIFKSKKFIFIGDWGLGIGDWGLGIGPNPQSPIPNPQSPIPNLYFKISLIPNNIILKKIQNSNNIFIKTK